MVQLLNLNMIKTHNAKYPNGQIGYEFFTIGLFKFGIEQNWKATGDRINIKQSKSGSNHGIKIHFNY